MNQEPNWQLYNEKKPKIPVNLHSWILHPGSFMQRLQEKGVRNASVQVLQENWQIPWDSEKSILNLENHETALIREVLISSEETHWMYARSVFPRQTLTEEYSELANLKNRSLGSVIFKDPALQRSEFELAILQPESEWFDKISQHAKCAASELWARRSLFHLKEKKLLLTEVFLPDIEKLP